MNDTEVIELIGHIREVVAIANIDDGDDKELYANEIIGKLLDILDYIKLCSGKTIMDHQRALRDRDVFHA